MERQMKELDSFVDNADDGVAFRKLTQMREAFQKLFRSKGYGSESTFGSDVWFMKGDKEFQNLIKNNTPGREEESQMITLLRDLSSVNNLMKIKINTEKFIHTVCQTVFKAHNMAARAREQINEYRAHENVSILEVKNKMLNQKCISNNKKNSISTLDIKLGRLDLLPKGQYSFKLKLKEMDPRDINKVNTSYNELTRDKLLLVKHANDVVVLNDSGNNENYFQRIEFSSLEISADKKFLNRFDYSGTTFSSFSLQIFNKEDLFAESSPENFLDMLLVLLPNLRDIEKDQFQVAWRISVKHSIQEDSNHPNHHNNPGQFLTSYDYLEFHFDLDPITRSSIIRRIVDILREAIRTESQNEMIKNEILDYYFSSISEEIKYILTKPDDEPLEGCTCEDNCLII